MWYKYSLGGLLYHNLHSIRLTLRIFWDKPQSFGHSYYKTNIIWSASPCCVSKDIGLHMHICAVDVFTMGAAHS